jgi:hypothetical protein
MRDERHISVWCDESGLECVYTTNGCFFNIELLFLKCLALKSRKERQWEMGDRRWKVLYIDRAVMLVP